MELSERPTPETDAAIIESNGQWSFVLRETCARMERERDEAIAARKASAADWLNQIEQANARVSRACRERDEAREAFAIATDQLVQAQSALRERDAAREKCHKLRRDRAAARAAYESLKADYDELLGLDRVLVKKEAAK